jgi:hypothetical protein
MMTYNELFQQNPLQNQQQQNPQHWGGINPQQFGQSNGQSAPGQAAYGQLYGQGAYGGQQFGQPNIGQNWMQQRQLSQQDVSEVVRQLVPLLPQVLAQSQQPLAAIGYGAYGQGSRLTQQDINEVVRQLLPIVPQILGVLQGQSPWQSAAAYGGPGQHGQGNFGQANFGQNMGMQNPAQSGIGQPFPQQQTHWQQSSGQFGSPFQAAYGNTTNWGQQHRQLSPQDINDVVRQLIGVIPQVMGNLQTFNQQRSTFN